MGPVKEMAVQGLLKEQGLELAEDVAVMVVEAVFKSIEMAVKASPSKLDDILLVMLPLLKPLALEKVDLIDGKVG